MVVQEVNGEMYQFPKRYDHISAIKKQFEHLFRREKTFDCHLGRHLVFGVLPKDASLSLYRFYNVHPASQKFDLRCHPVCMQLPTNANLVFTVL